MPQDAPKERNLNDLCDLGLEARVEHRLVEHRLVPALEGRMEEHRVEMADCFPSSPNCLLAKNFDKKSESRGVWDTIHGG